VRPARWFVRPALRLGATLASLLALGSCLPRDVTEPDDHRATTLLVRADVSAVASVATLVVEVTAADIPTPLVFNIPIADGVASGTITLPAGSNRTITMHAFDAGGVETHRGSTTVTIVAGTNPIMSLVLVPLAGDAPINATLGSFVVSVTPVADTLAIGGTATLTATIVDANGSPVPERVVWASLDPRIATVASTGDRTTQVTAVAPGATSVVASFGGSGGLAAIVVSPNPALELIAAGLSGPLYVTEAPGDTSRLFVVEQPGRIRVISHGTLLATPFLDLTSIAGYDGGERGLLSMAFHPNYAANGRFFVHYTDVSGNIQIAQYTVSVNPDVADPGSAQIVLSVNHATFANHNGGLVTFGPDGYLYVGLGDGGGGGDPLGNGQDSTTLLGSILRIDVDGGSPYVVPASNPFVGRPPAAPEIWAYGLRNPWRFSFDRLTGDLYIADVGQDVWEEVDVQPAASTGGQNYGWNIMEGAHCFNPATGCNTAGLALPTFEYSHGVNNAGGCSIIGGYVYRGKRLPALVGRYIFADLCGGWTKSFRLEGGTAVDLIDHTPQLGALSFPASFGEDSRGELYIVTQGNGNVYRIVPAP
jgi:glucose/arabinose dehydrogenase